MKQIVYWALLACFGFLSQAYASEEILSFHSDITVQTDGSLIVQETIKVRSERKQIRRGIYRDFPTDYKDRMGNRYRVGFELLEVKRDGVTEDYHTKRQANGVRIYIGHKDRQLKEGIYEYQLTYRTTRQLGYFERHDELYWNVTGNGWIFPILSATADVHLPEGISLQSLKLSAYTGLEGSNEGDFTADIIDSIPHFQTTNMLGSWQGLTVVVEWPKGFVSEPTLSQNIEYFAQDNQEVVVGLGALVLLLSYYLLAWSRVGRDIPQGVIVPEYFPPKGYSPASLRYVLRMGSYDNKTFAVAIVNLAVKGAIKISQSRKMFVVKRTEAASEIEKAPGEKVLLSKLFREGDTVELKQENHGVIGNALSAHKESLKRDYNKKYFVKNGGWLIPGWIFTFVVWAKILIGIADMSVVSAIMFGLFTLVWVYFATAIWLELVLSWGALAIGLRIRMIIISLAALGVLIASIYMAKEQGAYIPLLSLSIVVIGLCFVNNLFSELMKKQTIKGRKLQDKLEGFRLYLNVAEKDELNFKHAPKKTPDLFEIYLPYAMALDVENQWADRFVSVFNADPSHRPNWYSGHHWSASSIGSFSGAMGSSLSSAISSSSTAPGSSSGGGGGSSGGGGGGGGGGGW